MVAPVTLSALPISIHALREEGDQTRQAGLMQKATYFYPRPPRGGRPGTVRVHLPGLQISIHALREEGDRHAANRSCGADRISIHALREEGDIQPYQFGHPYSKFLSTPSARRATVTDDGMVTIDAYFYPRPPRGGRQQKQRQNLYFQTNYTTFCTNLEEP